MLIDQLQERDDSIRIISHDDKTFEWDNGPILTMPAPYRVEAQAFDELLTLLKIPTKYMRRCFEALDGLSLAENNINFWLNQNDISVLIRNDIITQVFDGKRRYVPAHILNDFIVEKLGSAVKIIHSRTDDDIFTATYIVKNVGIKILFSDCFVISPRIDGVYWDDKSKALFVVPVTGRKFRAADKDISSLMQQVDEFCNLAMENIRVDLLSTLDNVEPLTDTIAWVDSLVSELRLNRKIANKLQQLPTVRDNTMIKIAKRILAALFVDQLDIDMETVRNLQIAITNYIIYGSFK